ncbi:HTH-type transcriptional regulator GltC [compost metagenome]
MKIALTLQQLEAFAEVARTENFRAAAQHLHVSQPALSRTIRLAEEIVGVRLFDRDTRHVAMTPAGRELLPIARRILADFDSAFSELAQFLDGRSGHITIAAVPSATLALIPAAISDFRQRHPKVEFTFLEGPADAVKGMVGDGSADIGITVRPPAHEPFHYRHWLDDPIVLLCRADDPLAKKRAVPWAAFAQQPFISAGSRSSIRPITDAALLHTGLPVEQRLEYPSVASAGAMVLAGLGLTALPKLALLALNTAGLASIPLKDPVISRPIGFITRVGRSLSPVARALIEHAIAAKP